MASRLACTELSGPIGSLLKTTGGSCAATCAVVRAGKAPRPQHRLRGALVAESAVVVQRHRIDARAGIGRTCGARCGRAERHQHARLVVEARLPRLRSSERPRGRRNPFCQASLAISNAKILCSRPRASAAKRSTSASRVDPAGGERRAAEERPLYADAVTVVGQIGHSGDNGVIVGPSRIRLPVFPTGAADRSKHANIVDARGAQGLEIAFEPRPVELVGPGTPEQRGAERVEGPGASATARPSARTGPAPALDALPASARGRERTLGAPSDR